MTPLDVYLDDQLARGRSYFSREDALGALRVTPEALAASVTRMVKRRRLANPRHGFYLILRPEDRIAGAPDPVRWIDPLIKYQGIDYRISLLRAAAFHGSSHQAAMVFQVIVPKQLRPFEIGRHRLEFVYQTPDAFHQVNQPRWVGQIKSATGFAKVAGVELTLLDCTRYFHRVGGINAVAQIVRDIGGSADARRLRAAARVYENSFVRRLGYLLELVGHTRGARALEPFASVAKSLKRLDPSIKPLKKPFIRSLADLSAEGSKEGSNDSKTRPTTDSKWKLVIDEPVEIDF